MFEAARLMDEIDHTSAMTGFVLGAIVGIAAVAYVSLTFVTCGLGGILLGLAVGLAGNAIASLGESIGAAFSSAAGQIESGSPNVFINGRAAAFAIDSTAVCEKHSPIVKVAEGSSNVFINGKPAARKGDKLTCGAKIGTGSNNVFIGGGTHRYLAVDDEVSATARYVVDILLVVAGGARAVGSIAKLGLQAGLKAAGPCALRFMGGIVLSDAIVRFGVAPLAEKVLGGLHGNPVDTTTGRKLLIDESDFSLPGRMPIEWTRFYASDLNVDSVLGKGWVLPWEQSLRRKGSFLYLSDNQGRSVPFVTLDYNQRIYNAQEQLYLVRTNGGHYLVQTLDNVFYYFGEVPDDNQPVPLERIENALGHFLHFVRSEDGVLTDICATGGQRVHLHYDEVSHRLSTVKRIVEGKAVETLVRYHYDTNGQLNGVYNRNGDSVRTFSYTDGLMTRHANALGLGCEYRWEVLDDKPRVVEHWTSDGEHLHFDYDFEARQTRVTDVLGRCAQVTYNKDRRVIASTDFGGEQYRIALDDSGNITGLTLPDGNQLGFEYDDLSRLTAETDPLGRTTRFKHHYKTTLVKQVTYPDGSTWQARYDDRGNLITEIDALGNKTEYYNGEDGLPHTITDATLKSKYLWWNSLGQVERFQDCSGKSTYYRYDERHQLIAVTDALNNTTTLERKPGGEVLRIDHPDGSRERFTYNAHGQVLTHTNGKDQTTHLARNARGLPVRRQDPKGLMVAYQYDKALRLVALTNENDATYTFAYDNSDRLIEEKRIDQLTRRFSYNLGGHLTQVEETGYGEKGERPQRSTHFERDSIGRLLARLNDDARQDFAYDDSDRLLSIQRKPTDSGRKLGVTAEKLEFAYDILGRLTKEASPQGALTYDYDTLGNLTTLTLPTGQHLNHLYYGSGHLHQLNLDGQLISDIERDDLHREIYRTQGKLTSCFGYDAVGRKAWQYATTLPAEKLSQIQNPLIKPERYVEHVYNSIHRRYEYDLAGELSRTLDKLRGEVSYEYEANGRLLEQNPEKRFEGEAFRYDAAGNRLNFNTSRFDHVKDNRLKEWRNHEYKYDAWGNLIEKIVGIVRWQTFTYDSENRLVKTETMANSQVEVTSSYQYDSLGRRVGKQSNIKGQTDQKHFLWQGLRMLREESPEQSSLYLYEPGSYAPLARVDQREGEDKNKVYYYHTDQIGTPLEMTDAEGHIVWQAKYAPWGLIKQLVVNEVEQNLRFQGQYFDVETGLHYNTFRYYDPEIGRFITQDPIGLSGGDNLYLYAPNPYGWVDPWGLCNSSSGGAKGAGDWAKLSGKLTEATKGKGNFGIGSGTREQADVMGKAWVGDGYKVASDGKTLVSENGLRQYRPPTYKPYQKGTQANFEQRFPGQETKKWQSNAHLDITD
ncbi:MULTISPECIES: RHS repeat-associated core domain-containing protein [Pseudomonas syringae group]|uniref:Type IV secretion protein Rhs n=6 Tax=Pseudomonas syringae group TaxID=136849 RepID=A0AAD0DUL3_9PSED|nr:MULTISPECIES: RHS repeat-associated core domain-containing protein [Pseudomonas syringae group]AVB18210.1 type IV secretion protein Rhs [Pseudomonas avellanae]POP87937.1 type IV secretion protein Rhs [Pseudomonas amygdali pv. morsprunorum]RML51724.1 Rhs protein [Pseudomonas amygdali pv. morsprunorum]SOS31696.1 type IV secretion protein Rhs [Pseudomonas syringae group genomosp. 3]SPF10400.1 type IV secretion protein Rhs [Pseudomonas syringae group genomosp. 3]